MRLLYNILLSIVTLVAAGCSQRIDISGYFDDMPQVYPDYIGVTIPSNIAPLNFCVEGDQGRVAAIIKGCNDSIVVKASDGNVEIPAGAWQRLVEQSVGDSLTVTVCIKDGNSWRAFRPFNMFVSPDSIPPYLLYRRLPPLYGTWREMGIYQRSLSTFEEKAIYQNTAYRGNCVNCHSMCVSNPDKMLFHLRSHGGATYLYDYGVKTRLDTKTDSTVSNFTYPYWHPSGRYVAFSVNNIFQVFHTSDPNVTEVIDDASDIVVYDIKNNEAFSSPLIKSVRKLETFPAFSPDGATLYFCSAELPDSLPQQYKDVRYSLCAISFDAASATFGESVDTIVAADSVGGSISFPRPSPDGRRLMFTKSGYGNFSIWHKDADLWSVDLSNGTFGPVSALNSEDVESYHSWSSDSKWVVFSSRRDDGLYTRLYFSHISDNGAASKPFMLPQHAPKKYYMDLIDSYNIPEFADEEVRFGTRDVVEWIDEDIVKVGYRK